MDSLRFACLMLVMAVLALASPPARGDLMFRAFLSAQGNDANRCDLPNPCRLLPAALAAVRPGGEIWILDSGNFNLYEVGIDKSVTILAVPGALGSVVVNSGNGFNIDAPGVKVALRNIVIVNFAGAGNGVNFAQGAELTLEHCEIYGMSGTGTLGNGIYAHAGNGTLTVKDTIIRDNAGFGVSISGAVSATLDRVRLLANGAGGLGASSGPSVTISNSLIAHHTQGSGVGVNVAAASATATRVVVERSVLRANTNAVFAQTNTSGDSIQVSLNHNAISHNATGYGSGGVANSTVTTVLDDNVITENGTGVSIGFGIVNTRQNNTLMFNSSDVSPGSLTPVTAR